jgi:trigger factor
MKVVINEMEGCRRRLEVEIPLERVETEMARVFQDYSRHARLPGFRKGHVPMEVVRRRFAKEVRDEVVERLVRGETRRILEEKQIDPIGSPVLESVTFEDGKPLQFKALFEVQPKVSVDGYRNMAVAVPRHAVSDEMVGSYLEGLAERAARLEAIEGRPVQKGDYIVGTLSCRFLKGKGKDLKDESLMLEAGSDENHPDFNAAILGLSAGDTKTFLVEYPDDYNAVSLRGRHVEYTLSLKEIKKKVRPPIDDELAKELGNFASLDELRAKVREELERRAAAAERAEAKNRLLADLVGRHPIEVPESMIETQLDARVEALARELVHRGADPTQADIDWPKERERARPGAVDSVRAMLILDAIAEREGIAATEDDVNAWLKEEARRSGASVAAVKEKLSENSRLTGLRRQIVREKSLDFLLHDATITPEVK